MSMRVEEMIKERHIQALLRNTGELSCNELDNIEDKLNAKKQKILKILRDKLIESFNIQAINSKEKFNLIRNAAWTILEDKEDTINKEYYLDSYDKAEILEVLLQTMFGYGIIDPLIKDTNVTEIMVNDLDKIFIEKAGKIERAKNKKGEKLKFNNIDELKYIIEKIVAPINRKVDESNPIVDARLPNGFRVNVALNPISLDGHVLTIRKFPENPYSMEDLVRFETLPLEAANFLKFLVEAKYNIIISGGTGSGKTTFLNALSNFIGRNSRIITIEDSAELKISNIENLVRLETRPPNIEGKGEITIRDLLRSALRMRPDRIIVGEVRGGEALDMLQAMNTGHDGSLSTGHANSAVDMLSRLETMVLMSGLELPLASVRQQISSAVEVIVHLGKLQNGSRKVLQITEILGVDKSGYSTQNLFEFSKNSGEKDSPGKLIRTRNKMKRTEKFMFAGLEMKCEYLGG